jgi:hypothetical protein
MGSSALTSASDLGRSTRGREEQQWWGAHSCMLATPRTHGTLLGIPPSTWRATMWPVWELILGHFRANLVDGPKTKFDLQIILSNFDEGSSACRAIDQRVISPQYGNVNVLKMVTETRLRRSKLGQTQCNFLHALLHNITFNFYFWTNSSCLTNFGERGMPMSKTLKSGR